MDLILDVNTFLYPLNKDDKFTLALAPKLSLREGVQDSAYFDQVRIASQNYQALLDRRTMQGRYGIIAEVSLWQKFVCECSFDRQPLSAGAVKIVLHLPVSSAGRWECRVLDSLVQLHAKSLYRCRAESPV